MKIIVLIKLSNAALAFLKQFALIAERKNLKLILPYEVKSEGLDNFSCIQRYHNYDDPILQDAEYLISIGGDGTFLETINIIRHIDVPVLGINLGRLGFLANNKKEELENVLDLLKEKTYSIEERSLLEFSSDIDVFGKQVYALNDFTIHKRDSSSLSTISAFINNDFFNTYWGDGLIVSTPTGSTAYSMSCGGPIVFPETNCLIITPVAPHNLNVRPVIVPDNVTLSFEIRSREKDFMVALDSRYHIVDHSVKINVRKADFNIHTVSFEHQCFSKIIAEKLMWGIDKRNF